MQLILILFIIFTQKFIYLTLKIIYFTGIRYQEKDLKAPPSLEDPDHQFSELNN